MKKKKGGKRDSSGKQQFIYQLGGPHRVAPKPCLIECILLRHGVNCYVSWVWLKDVGWRICEGWYRGNCVERKLFFLINNWDSDDEGDGVVESWNDNTNHALCGQKCDCSIVRYSLLNNSIFKLKFLGVTDFLSQIV